jgi:hypothetical protein
MPKPEEPKKEESKPAPAPVPAPKDEYKYYTFGEEITLKCEGGKIVVKAPY